MQSCQSRHLGVRRRATRLAYSLNAADIARIRAFHTGSTPRGCIEDERVGAGRALWGSPQPSQQPAPMQDLDAARRGYRLMHPTVSLLMHDATDIRICAIAVIMNSGGGISRANYAKCRDAL